MNICDLSHLEVASEDNNVVGGISFADANAFASASGPFFASTDTRTYTAVSSSFFRNTSVSASSSSSAAA